MTDDERQARISAIRSDLARPWQEVERAVETARWLLAELEAATARAERAEAVRVAYRAWEDALDEFYGDSVEYAGWMDRVDALRKSARAALAGGQGEG